MNKNYGGQNMVSEEDNTRQPNFFIVGAPKCGTTSMVEYLRQHLDVFIPFRELHFFGSDIFRDKKLTEEDYLDCFSKARNEKRVGEKSTWYLYSKKAASEIKKFSPHAKIIIQIRNPVDMVYSLHSDFLRSGQENIINFEKALEAEEDRRKGLRIPKRTVDSPKLLSYSEIPLYAEQIKRYVEVFGWKQIHIIVFDDLVKDTLNTYREVLRFLDVDDQFTPDLKIYNAAYPRRSMLLQIFMKSFWAKKIGRTLLPYITRCIIGQTISHWNISNKLKPPMKKHVRKRLQKQFEPEVKRLSKLLNRDLSHWCED